MDRLNHGYVAEVDEISRDQWSQLVLGFADANLFQTWIYGSVHWAEETLSHLVLKRHGQIVAAAQVWHLRLPVVGRGLAHISWGPMWRLRGKELDPEVVRNMIRALQQEYVIRRRLLLRIRSNEIDDDTSGRLLRRVFTDEHFRWRETEGHYHTMRLKLAPDLKDIRANLHSSWRRHLNRAEKKGLEVLEGTEDEMFRSFSEIYHDMVSRKGFTRYVYDVKQYAVVQQRLPESSKMRIFLCRFQGEDVAGIVVSTLGDTALHLLSATSTRAIELKLDAAYLLHWRVIARLKEMGLQYYDLFGYSPGEYSGVSSFKAGLGGEETRSLGCVESCRSVASLLFVRTGELMDRTNETRKVILKKVKDAIHKIGK